MGIPNNYSPLAFVPSPDHVVFPIVVGPTHHVVVGSFFVGHAAHVASFAFLDATVVPSDIPMMLQLVVDVDHIVNVAFVGATSFVAAAIVDVVVAASVVVNVVVLAVAIFVVVVVVCCVDVVVVAVGAGVDVGC